MTDYRQVATDNARLEWAFREWEVVIAATVTAPSAEEARAAVTRSGIAQGSVALDLYVIDKRLADHGDD